MADATHLRATICVVHYRTLELTRLCLRSLRRFTPEPCEVVVVDNDSRDASTEYLRSLSWIRLIERRPTSPDRSGAWAHAAALDLGLEAARAPVFVSLHSDAFVRREGWLSTLLAPLDRDPRVASVGSGKLEGEAPWRARWKALAEGLYAWKRRLQGRPRPAWFSRPYHRTVCALYRTDVLRREGLSFTMGFEEGFTAGQRLHFALEERGLALATIPEAQMETLVTHLAHATQVVNAGEFSLKRRAIAATERRMARLLESDLARSLLADEALDR